MKIITVLMVGILCFTSVDAIGNTREIQEARIAGENDAKGFNWKWFAVSYMTTNAAVVGAMLAAWANANLLTNALDTLNHEACLWSICGIYALAPTAVAIIHTPTPPAERLLGKSPDWVNAYTKAYQKNMRGYRVASTMAGSCIGGAVLATTVYIILPLGFTGD